MKGELQNQGQIDKYLQEWLSPRVRQPNHDLSSQEENQELLKIDGSAPERGIIINQDPEG